eukprot:TRINITY_DN6494_c1_g1_i5.p1 TRINITY_DN6494_c1_g1~~TRINITY_DN6494_c1_g1_i5.p1  ORF type:complete len:269 (+),score=39.92 TRINITY_DN6494_c1_g1_i5:523-1329(+)
MEENLNPLIVHGPSSSAERRQVKKSKIQLDREKQYLQRRYNKLEQQSKPKSLEVVSKVFSGCCVYFPGLTDQLSSLHLKKLVRVHSGNVIPYFSAKRITHVVSTTMSGSKAENFISRLEESGRKSSIYVVHSNWIIDSCKAGRLLSEIDYLVCKKPTEKITSYFTKENVINDNNIVVDDRNQDLFNINNDNTIMQESILNERSHNNNNNSTNLNDVNNNDNNNNNIANNSFNSDKIDLSRLYKIPSHARKIKAYVFHNRTTCFKVNQE